MATRITACLALALVTLFAGGCRRAHGPTVPRELQRYARGIPGTTCPHADQVVYVMPGVVQVRGCGLRRELVLHGAREAPVPVPSIEDVAMHQLSCEARALTVESPGPAVRAVRGCGREGRFDLVCERGTCAWRMTAHAGRWDGMPEPTPDAPAWVADAWPVDSDVAARGLTSGTPASEVDLSTVALPPPPGESSAPDDVVPAPSDAPTPTLAPSVVPPPS